MTVRKVSCLFYPRANLKQYGAGAAPVELITDYKETLAKMSRTEAFKA